MGLSAASSAWRSLTFLQYVFDVLPQFLKSLLTCHLLDEVHPDRPLSFDDLISASLVEKDAGFQFSSLFRFLEFWCQVDAALITCWKMVALSSLKELI